MKKILVLVAVSALLQACLPAAPAKTITPELGESDRGAGIVRYTYSVYHKSVFDGADTVEFAKAQAGATNMCRKWGYSSAKRLSTQKSECIGYSYGTCVEFLQTMTYQCL